MAPAVSPRTDAIIAAVITHAPTIGAALIALTLTSAAAVILLDQAERRLVELTHQPHEGEQ